MSWHDVWKSSLPAQGFLNLTFLTAEFQTSDPKISDLGCEHWSKTLPPITDRLVADIDTAFMQ